MLYNYKEVIKKYKNDYKLNLALNDNEIFKVEKGIYSDSKNPNLLGVYSKRYPNSIITMDSAFYFYNFTDVIPTKIHLATASSSHTIENSKINQIFVKDSIFDEGKVSAFLENEKQIINIYDKERLLIELIRKKSQIPLDYYKEIIRNYREESHLLNVRKLEKYASFYHNSNKLLEILQMEVFWWI